MIGVPQSLDELAAYEASSKAFLPEDYASVGVHRDYIRRLLDDRENPFAVKLVERLLKSAGTVRELSWDWHNDLIPPLQLVSCKCEERAELFDTTVDLVLNMVLKRSVEFNRKLIIVVSVDSESNCYTEVENQWSEFKNDDSEYLGAIVFSIGFGNLSNDIACSFPLLTVEDMFTFFHENCLGGVQLELFKPNTAYESRTPKFIIKWVSSLGAEVARRDLVRQVIRLLGDDFDSRIARKLGYRSWEHFAFYALEFFSQSWSWKIEEANEPSLTFSFGFVSSWHTQGPSLRLYSSPFNRRIVDDAPTAGWGLAVEINRMKFLVASDDRDKNWAADWMSKYGSSVRHCAELAGFHARAHEAVDDNQRLIVFSWPIDLSDRVNETQKIQNFVACLYRYGIISHRELEVYRNAK